MTTKIHWYGGCNGMCSRLENSEEPLCRIRPRSPQEATAQQHIWIGSQRDEWIDWLTLVRERRNAVHAFNHREIGKGDEFWQAVIRYHEFVGDLDSRVPYSEYGERD